jgi:hypothetical protein
MRAIQSRVPLNCSQRRLAVGTRSIDIGSGDYKVTRALAILQEVDRSCIHNDSLSTRLALGEIDKSSLKIDMTPLKSENLPQSSGKHLRREQYRWTVLPSEVVLAFRLLMLTGVAAVRTLRFGFGVFVDEQLDELRDRHW